MQIERLFEIVYILLEKGTVTAQELSDKLNVSKRTILRDIETLTLAKVPVCTTQGKGGGIYVLENFHPDRNYLNEKQTELLERLLETLEGEDRTTMQGIIRTCALPQKGGLYGRKNP